MAEAVTEDRPRAWPPFRVLVLGSEGSLADRARAALDLAGVGVDVLPAASTLRTLLPRALRANTVLRLASGPEARESKSLALARLLGRGPHSWSPSAGPESPSPEAGPDPGESRILLEGLATTLLREMGARPPLRPTFASLGGRLRTRQDEIWTAMTWPPPDPAIRGEADEELTTLRQFVAPHEGWSLDVGSGAGRGARTLARGSRSVAALDLSLEMLRRLRAGAGAEGAAPIHPVLGDAERLPFRAGVFRSVTAIQVWAHLEFAERLTGELERITTTGARLALSTGNAHSLIEAHDRLALFLHELRRGRLHRALRALRGDRTYWLTLRGFARSTVDSVVDELGRSNFEVTDQVGVGLLRTPHGHLPAALSRWPAFRRFGHLLLVGARRRPDAPRVLGSWGTLGVRALSSFVSPDGELAYRRTADGEVESLPPAYSTRDRYRLISLLGCESYRRTVGPSRPLDDLVKRLALRLEPSSLDDLGLFLWWKALRGEGDIGSALARARQGGLAELSRQDSQTLAFLLLGLSMAVPAGSAGAALVLDVAALLRSRQEGSGLFHAVARRDAVATFNYQVYSALALAVFAGAYARPADLAAARACAECLCRLQGPLGQWWWTYDVHRGRVADRYPVFTVHQLGMAPLALFRVGKACAVDFSPWVRRGARWVNGPNEAGASLVLPERDIVWRSVRRRGAEHPFVAGILKRLAWYRASAPAALLPPDEINREHRSYEYGWLLAALAEAGGDESWLP